MTVSVVEGHQKEATIPSGTVTFLFTDIEGSTKLLERLREQYALVLEDQRQILRAAFANWNGHEMDTQGDSFFVVFPRAINALCCVIEGQKELAAHTWPEGVNVRVRMGIHTGEPILVGKGETGSNPNLEMPDVQRRPYLVGMDVHRAARIAAVGYGGQVLLSQTTRDLVFMDLPKGTSLRDLGSYKLKDIRFPQQIYQLDIEGLAVDFPALKTLSAEEEPATPGDAPYQGLQFFDEADAAWFFGREKTVSRLVEAIQEQRFLAVIGASGSGKSSVVRAGLVPALRKLGTAGQIFVFTPTLHPLEALAVSLTREACSAKTAATLIDDLRADMRSLHLFVRKMLPAPATKQPDKALLVIDQFEELFTQCRSPSERQSFVDNLLYAVEAENGPLSLVIVLRADFYQHLAQYDGLRQLVAKRQEYLGAMNLDEMRLAIEEPAQRGGWEFSPGLVELMLHEVGTEPGALPLLSHALLETWNHRRGNTMLLRSYFEAGGVSAAIARTAERVYRQELSAEQQPLARSIFLRLTELGEGTQDTRRRVRLAELIPHEQPGNPQQVREVINRLADARLVTVSEENVEVAHEALIREWPALREWLAADREGLRLHRRLTEAAQEWELLKREPGALYRGSHLAQAQEWAEMNPGQLNDQEQDFLEASRESSQREAREREEQSQRELTAARKLAETQTMAAKRLRRRAVYLLAALVIAGLLAAAAVFFGQQSNKNAQLAGQNLATAQSERQRAEGEARQRATQQAIAEEQARLASSRELAAAAASKLQIDPELGILLSLEALKKADTAEAKTSLLQSLMTFRLSATIPADSTSVIGVAVDLQGKRFASLGMDGLVKIWALGNPAAATDPTPLLSLADPIEFYNVTGYGSILAFSPDGSRLAAIGEKHCAKIWDTNNGKLLQTLNVQKGHVYTVSFSPDGNRLVTTSASGSATVWDVLTGQDLMTITVPGYELDFAVFTPDGRGLVTGASDTIRFWDLETNPVKELSSLDFGLDLGGLNDIAFSPDGRFLAITGLSGGRVWNMRALQLNPSTPPMFTFSRHNDDHIYGLTYTPDGARLVTGSLEGSVTVWDAASGNKLFTLPENIAEEPYLNDLAISPDGIHPISASSDGKVRIWDISPTGSYEWWTVYPVTSGRFSSDGKHLTTLFASDRTGILTSRSWELSSSGAREVFSNTLNSGTMLTAFQANRDLSLLASTGYDMVLKVWEATTGQLVQSFPIRQTASSGGHTQYAIDLKFSPDSTRIVSAGDDGKAIIWEVASGKPLVILSGHHKPVDSVDFSPDGTRIATGSNDGTARIWDANTGETLQTLSSKNYMVMAVLFSPDGKRLLTGGGGDNIARVWNVQTGQELLSLSGHTGAVDKVAYSPDGRLIATGSGKDGTVRIWDATSGQALQTFPGHDMAFGADGNSLAVFSDDLTGRGYYLDMPHIIALARSRLTRTLTTAECQQYLHIPECPQ
jgi:WD40 repeat protein/class 3 adenylate cyclase/energy-coupling factor transporter ATP-binding protein EcfA2